MKDIGSLNLSAAQAARSYPVDFVKLIIDPNDPSNQLRLTTLYFDVDITEPDTNTSQTYNGAGHLLGVSSMRETQEAKQISVDVTLSGLDPTVTSYITDTRFIGAPITIYRGFFDDTAGGMVADPFLLWDGLANDYSLSFAHDFGADADDQEVAITVSCQSMLTSILETQNGRYTSPQTSNFFEFTPSLVSFNPQFGAED